MERLCERLRSQLSSDKFDGRLGLADVKVERVYLLEPQTFMKLSGRSAAQAARFYKVEPADVLVIHDELDMPFGRLQLKNGGGSGGHNGLKSCTESFGTEAYGRLRFGIDKPVGPNAKDRVSGHVLSDFRGEEVKPLPDLIDRAAEGAELWISLGMAQAMNRFNRK